MNMNHNIPIPKFYANIVKEYNPPRYWIRKDNNGNFVSLLHCTLEEFTRNRLCFITKTYEKKIICEIKSNKSEDSDVIYLHEITKEEYETFTEFLR